MKANIHPFYRTVMFHDTRADTYYKVGSTIKTEKTIDIDGQSYPYVTLEISAASHPHYTGKQKQVSSEERIAKFHQRFGQISSPKGNR